MLRQCLWLGLLLITGMAYAQSALNSGSATPAEPISDTQLLHDLYINGSLLWFQSDHPTRQALAAIAELQDVAAKGLRPADYHAAELSTRLQQWMALSDSVTNEKLRVQRDSERTALDMTISMALIHLVHDLHYGRLNPRQAGFNWQRSPDLDIARFIGELSTTQDMSAALRRIEPQYAHYQLLKDALNRYRQLASQSATQSATQSTTQSTGSNPLTQLPTLTRSVKPGEAYEGAPALHRLLRAEQDLVEDQSTVSAADSDLSLDGALVEALKRYQTRHGLNADGALGKQTFAALTTPFSKRVEQIELTLERWRWLPPLKAPMIVVNIPQFKLFALTAADDDEAHLLRMDVIVGQAFEHTRTPVFLADMQYVVFRPYWDVPRDIAVREMLPSIQKNPAYLARNQLELVEGQRDASPVVPATAANIARLAAGELRVRQLPGDSNALGEVKFMLPNRYNVYLHSTPTKHLFKEARRAFSHGCIRVSDPAALAEYVLRNAADRWDTDKIQTAMQGDRNQRVNLTTPIPVLIVYGTVMPLESGVVQFFDDLYGHDAKLAKLLRQQATNQR